MRFKIVPEALEVGELELEFAPGIVFTVRRAGYAPFVEDQAARQRDFNLAQMQEAARAAVKAAAGSKGNKPEEVAEEASEAFVATLEARNEEHEERMAALLAPILLDDNRRGVAMLVESVRGLEDENGPVEWSLEVGADLFGQYPVIRLAVLEKANELETAYQAFIRGAEKNSVASSELPTVSDATN